MVTQGDLYRISTNQQALRTLKTAYQTNRKIARRRERLATGKRINRAEEDSAGYSIAKKLEAKTRGQAQALQNITDAKGMLSVAESAAKSVSDITVRLKELAVRASNDSMGPKERLALHQEAQALIEESGDVIAGATFNERALFSDTESEHVFQVGADMEDSHTVRLPPFSKEDLFQKPLFVRSAEGNPLPRGLSSPYNADNFEINDLDGDGSYEAILSDGVYGSHFAEQTSPDSMALRSDATNPLHTFSREYPTDTEFSDLDGDGDEDAVMATWEGDNFRLYDNDGSGNFTRQSPTTNTSGGLRLTRDDEFAMIDADEDGDDDIVSVPRGGTVQYHEKIDGAWEVRTGEDNPFAGISVGYNSDLAAADLTGDGIEELIQNDRGELTWYGKQTVDGETSWVDLTETHDPFADVEDENAGIAFADLNGDGKQDFVFGSRLYQNVGTEDEPLFEQASSAQLSGVDDIQLSFSDVDSDGDMDAVASGRGGFDTALYRNTGDSTTPQFTKEGSALDPEDMLGRDPAYATGDVDGDGKEDVVVTSETQDVTYLRNVGTNSAPSYQRADAGDNPFDGLRLEESDPELHDLDNDGDDDLVVGHADGVRYFENDGGAFTERTGSANPLGGIKGNISFDDIDGDGDEDLAVADPEAGMLHYERTGTSDEISFRRQDEFPLNPYVAVDAEGAQPELADFDQDGTPELFTGTGSGDYYKLSDTGIDLRTREAAQASMYIIADALEDATEMLSTLGDAQKRLTFKQKNLSTSRTNYEAARSRIEDADFAREQMELAKLEILKNAGLASITQANSAPESVLSLMNR